jgi:NADPH2:quinone reductase
VTAFDALIRQARLAHGERVLISGAAGGVGTAAVQIAKLIGATVVAVTRDARHHDALRRLGADETITISELDELEPVSVILELVGAANLTHALLRCAPSARVVVIGCWRGFED